MFRKEIRFLLFGILLKVVYTIMTLSPYVVWKKRVIFHSYLLPFMWRNVNMITFFVLLHVKGKLEKRKFRNSIGINNVSQLIRHNIVTLVTKRYHNFLFYLKKSVEKIKIWYQTEMAIIKIFDLRTSKWLRLQ